MISGLFIGKGPNRQCDTSCFGRRRAIPSASGRSPGYFDWGNVRYDFQNATDFEDGQHTDVSVAVQELTFEMFATALAADVAVAMGATPATVVTGGW